MRQKYSKSRLDMRYIYKCEKERNGFPYRFPIRKWKKEINKKYYAWVDVSLSGIDKEFGIDEEGGLDFNDIYVCEYYYFLKKNGEVGCEYN